MNSLAGQEEGQGYEEHLQRGRRKGGREGERERERGKGLVVMMHWGYML